MQLVVPVVVMQMWFIVGCLVVGFISHWLVGWLAASLVGWLVFAWFVVGLFGWLLASLVTGLIGCS